MGASSMCVCVHILPRKSGGVPIQKTLHVIVLQNGWHTTTCVHVLYMVTVNQFVGWFSMSPLPRLHHHDIMTIAKLFSIYVPFVTILHQDKVFVTFDTDKKKFHSLAPALTLTLTVTLRPNHSATRHC